MKRCVLLSVILAAMAAFCAGYNVRMPSTASRPRFQGAKPGEWTMDYTAARAQAIAEGRGMLVLTTGSWWCPHCEAFEEKVLLDHASQWRNYVQEKGYYLVMLDFPYRGHVSDAELSKSKYPEYGDGWGFQCWLYDEDYLAENGLSKTDGLNAIMDMYRLQKELALPTAQPYTIKTWDGSEDFTYGKVGYPTLIVNLPDGREAGRFSPGATNRESDDAYNYVVEKIDSIVKGALDQECWLCSEPEAWGLSGDKVEKYCGWIKDDAGVIGTFEAKTAKKTRQRSIKISVTAVIDGQKRDFSGVGQDCCIDTVVLSGKKGDDGSFELMFGDDGISGIYSKGADVYAVTGARDVFYATDKVAKARRKLVTPGRWNFAMAVTNAPSDHARGYGAFSVSVKKTGQATLSGRLPNGSAVSMTGKAIVGDSDLYCVPFSCEKRQNGFGFCLWFKNGWLFNVSDIRAWRASFSSYAFTAGWRAVYSAVPDPGKLAVENELILPDAPETLGRWILAKDPNGDIITVRRTQMAGTELSKFRASLNQKQGSVSGSMKLFVEKNGGGTVMKTCKVNGVVIDGTAYCSAWSSAEGSCAVKVSSCAACED